MNDNPNKEDVKRAEVDSARRHMAAKTDDERAFYKKKLKSLKQHIKESPIHPRVKSAIDHAPDDLVLHSAKGAYRRLRGQKIDSGIKSSKSPKGSSRAVLNTREHDIILDGKPAKVPGVLKMVIKGSREKIEGRRVGVLQNKAEGSKEIQKHATMVQLKSGKWKTNPKGVVPPVLAMGTNDKYLHMGHARNASHDDIRRLTKSDVHPNGLAGYDLMDRIEYPERKDLKSPIVKKFRRFMKATGVSDFHQDNMGIWTHPHTGEEHLVLRDAGFDNTTKKAYRDTSFEYNSSSSKFHPDEFEAISRFTKLKTKKSEAKKFKQYVKEDWKRAALIGGSTIGASAAAGAWNGLGALPGAAIGATYYALSGNLKKDLRYKVRRKKGK
jgi:hypothetical protein